MNRRHITRALTAAAVLTAAYAGTAQVQGPVTGSTPYVLPTQPGWETTSLLTVDNTFANPDDTILKIGGGSYAMTGIPDGLGAFDNGDGTFTLLMNHEIGNTAGNVHDHGARGAFVSRFVIDPNTLAVLRGADLMKQVYGWNSTTQQSNPTPGTFAFTRFCSADLAAPTAYFNAATGLGTTARIFLNGEESGATGWAVGSVATGSDDGKSYLLGKFNLSTNGSTLTGVGGWENVVASPFAQDKTVVIGTNDGGTGTMNNSVAVYVGTKQAVGSEVDKAGLTNGVLSFVRVAGSATEIVNTTTRATNITNGTRFSLSGTSSTTFSRPEDGAWNPLNPRQFYFVTTDQLDQVSDGIGSQVGQTRLWRLTFDDITNPDAGGVIDLLINGRTVGNDKVNMFDNITVNEQTGHLILQEDVGGAAHNGKLWDYDPATDTLIKVAKHDPARFGDRVANVTTPATAPFTNDEESSGVIDITRLMLGSPLHKGNPGEAWYISSDQAHYTSGITAAQVEGGQMFVLHQIAPQDNAQVTRSGFVRDRRTGTFAQQVTITNTLTTPLAGPFFVVLDGLSANATLANASGVTANFPPLASPYIVVPGSSAGLAPGASFTVTLQFTNPSNGAISYVARLLNGISNP